MKAVALLSGGLDSTLAVRLMLEQGVEVIALNFTTPFCNCTAKSGSCKSEAIRVAREFSVPIQMRSKGMEYLEIVQHPRHGHGRGLNPCVDCRIYMHREAHQLMIEKGASFLVTGEVLGQRPMSQRRETLRIIERESGTEGLVLRPLSAQHFAPTIAEQRGWVDRTKLLAISGRSRKEQILLAEGLGIADYPCPAGGCLLTDQHFAGKLADLFENQPGYTLGDVQLLKVGRHFRLTARSKAIVGRNESENRQIARQAGKADLLLEGEDFKGPTVLVQGEIDKDVTQRASRILLFYAKTPSGRVSERGGASAGQTHAVKAPLPLHEVRALAIPMVSG